MKLQGRIFKVMPVQSGKSQAGNEWRKQDFIFEFFENPTDRYSDKVLLSVMNDRIEEWDLHEGDEARIGFGHSVREYNGRWFNELRAYSFEKIKASGGASQAMEAAQPAAEQPRETAAQTAAGQPRGTAEKKDDLPF